MTAPSAGGRGPRAQDLGREAEAAACRHLTAAGLSVVARNVRTAAGELDAVCRDGDTWVFVEVRSRSSERYGGAAFAVPPAKQRQVAKVARDYLLREGLWGRAACRFDVVLVDAAGGPLRVTHIPNAFTAPEG